MSSAVLGEILGTWLNNDVESVVCASLSYTSLLHLFLLESGCLQEQRDELDTQDSVVRCLDAGMTNVIQALTLLWSSPGRTLNRQFFPRHHQWDSKVLQMLQAMSEAMHQLSRPCCCRLVANFDIIVHSFDESQH